MKTGMEEFAETNVKLYAENIRLKAELKEAKRIIGELDAEITDLKNSIMEHGERR